MSALIEVDSLCMRYPLATAPVLQDLGLQVISGRFVAILGRSGSGKSTLLNLLGAMDKPDSGKVRVGGTDLTTLDDSGRTRFRRRHLGFIFQSFNLLPMLNVHENVALPLALNGRRDPARVDTLLAGLGLSALAARHPGQLSGGEQQRVAIARAVVHEPRLVLADEPTGNLDLESSSKVLDLLRELGRSTGTTLLMATHSLEAAAFADERWQLVEGRLVPMP
jgi:putative ABC transport system ATP-binding protein